MIGNEEADLLREAEEEALERGESIAFSHLRRTDCKECGRPALAIPAHVATAACGPCLLERTGAGEPFSGPYSVPVGYPRGVDQRVPVEPPAHPQPAVSSREPMPLDAPMPESVMKLAEFAREAGWEVRVQYARGNGIHGSTGKPTGLVHSLAVRMGNHPMTDAQAVAVYVSGSSWTWKSIWVSGPELPPFGAAGLTELKEWLDAAGDVPPGWYSTIAERVAEQERRRKIKEACDRGTHGNTITLGALTSCHYCTNSWETGAQPWRKPKKAKEHA